MQLDFFAKLTTRIAGAFLGRSVPRMDPGEDDASALRERARTWLRALDCATIAARLEVRWNRRMRSTAGMAYAATGVIVLNPRIREFGKEETERTLKHELAHLIAHHRAGRRRIAPHGKEWRQACADLDLPGEERCHTLPLPRRQHLRPYHYRCPRCGDEVRRTKPFRHRSACLACCRRYAEGRYDERFRFVKISSSAQAANGAGSI
jgi:SprT protein